MVEQPDLNWRNPDPKVAMFDTMRFWLDKGVDGFRVDIIYGLVRAARLQRQGQALIRGGAVLPGDCL